MKLDYQIGDLVHIPQAVELLDCDVETTTMQLTIPLRVEETDAPKIGIVTQAHIPGGYVRIFCEGTSWSVKNDKVYFLKGREAE